MKRKATLLLLLTLFLYPLYAQNTLIEETEDFKIFHTPISVKYKDNLFPAKYKNGYIFTSGSISDYYEPYYTNMEGSPVKIKAGSRYRVGGVTTVGDTVYYTAIAPDQSYYEFANLMVYRGILKNWRITKSRPVKLGNRDSMFAHPSLSPSGNKMVVVSNERGRLHLVEFMKSGDGKWKKDNVLFIIHPSFDILNPTYKDENTIYFSSNVNTKVEIDNVHLEEDKDSIKVVDVEYKPTSYNIYSIERINDKWAIPKKMEALSSEFDDLGVLFIDEKTGYLTTFRYENTDNFYYFELKQP